VDRFQLIILCIGGFISAVLIVGGLIEIKVGRRKIRTASRYGVVGRTNWRTVITGVAFALAVIGEALRGWFVVLVFAGVAICTWSLVHYRRRPARDPRPDGPAGT